MAQIYKQILNLASFSLIIYQGARVTALLRLIGAQHLLSDKRTNVSRDHMGTGTLCSYIVIAIVL